MTMNGMEAYVTVAEAAKMLNRRQSTIHKALATGAVTARKEPGRGPGGFRYVMSADELLMWSQKTPRRWRGWGPASDDFLMQNYHRMTAEKIAVRLGAPRNAVIGRAYRLGLKKRTPPQRKWWQFWK